MKRCYYCFLSGLIIFVFGCAHTPGSSDLPQHVRRISVQQFMDQTGHSIVSRKLTEQVVKEFLYDKRMAVVNPESADALLLGKITKYILEPLSFDESYIPEEYKLWIWVDIGFKDMVSNKILWVEKRMAAEVRYFVTPRKGGNFLTEEEAQEIVIKLLAEDIVKRTIDGWFAASGISEKK